METLQAKLDQPPTIGWYSVREAGIYMSMSEKAVRTAERAGKIQSTRSLTGLVRFRREWLDNFMVGG